MLLRMHFDAGMKNAALIYKCQKSIFKMYVSNIMITEVIRQNLTAKAE